MTDPRVRTILEHVPDGSRVLDLGCVQHDAAKADSENWLHKHLYDIAAEVLGVDILGEDIAELHERGYNTAVADAEAFHLGERFDAIVAGDIIEHLSCPGAMLDRCREHLAPGGRLIISTPNPWVFVRVAEVALGQHDPNPEHTCWFGPDVLRELLSRHGYQIERMELTEPPSSGVSRVLYRLGLERIGGTQFVVVATPEVHHS